MIKRLLSLRAWAFTALLLLVAVFFVGNFLSASAQITDEVQVPNANFDEDGGACTNWDVSGDTGCYLNTSIPGTNAELQSNGLYSYWIREHANGGFATIAPIQFGETVTATEMQTATFFSLPVSMWRQAAGFAHSVMCVDFFDEFGDPVGAQVCEPETGGINHPGGQGTIHTFNVTGSPPALARSFRFSIEASTSGDRNVLTEVGPMSVTFTPDAEEEEPDVNVDVDVVVDGDFDVDPQDIQDAINYAANLQNALCDSIPDLSSLAFVPDAWGGAGIGGQIAQIQQGVKDACFQESQITAQTEISDGLNNPNALPSIPDPAAYDDPQSSDISDRLNSAFGSATYQDNTVTAVNRQNDLLVYQTRVLVAQQERIYGRRDDPAAAISYDAPLISELDVDADPALAFAEGSYDQVKTKLSDETAPPDLAGAVLVSATLDAPVGGGSCLMTQSTAPPDNYDSLSAAWDIIRWNASVRIAETPLGSLACELASQPARSVTDVCYGDLGYGDELCVYGGTAMPVVTSTLDLFPPILLILAGIVVLRLWFG
jgi:hypothetical protein